MNDKSFDCSDLDRIMGIPIQPGHMREPFSNMDIRRWAQAMHYANLIHHDLDIEALATAAAEIELPTNQQV
jgi:hypothetical protein